MIHVGKITDIVRLGLHGVVVHKVRSVLTILGILFGVWSVIAMLAINAGLSAESQRALRQLGSTNIIIDSAKPASAVAKASSGFGALNYGLTHADVARLRDNVPGVRHCAIVHRTNKNARVGAKSLSVAVAGIEANYSQVVPVEMQAGRFIFGPDVLLQRACTVITASLARRLFAYRDPIGQNLHLNDMRPKSFKIVGVLRRLPNALVRQAGEGGDCAIVPISTDMFHFGRLTMMLAQGSFSAERVDVSQCVLQMVDEQAVMLAAPVVRSLLARYHSAMDYEIRVPVEEIALMKADRRRWNFMFFMIASVSLLVGGIGIMNIMLASVTERTREIGIRRALGAKRRHIVVQFLVESVTLTTIGGLLGIVIGLLVPWVVHRVLEFTTLITPATLLVPFLMAVAVGLVSGLYPALRAARLDPIEALRHE